MRERVRAFAHGHDVLEPDTTEFISAVSEAFANAIEHAHATEAIEVSCWMSGDRVFATIVDHGAGFASTETILTPALPDPLAEGGRGLPIMRTYTDLFSVRSTPGMGTSVILGRQVQRAHPR